MSTWHRWVIIKVTVHLAWQVGVIKVTVHLAWQVGAIKVTVQLAWPKHCPPDRWESLRSLCTLLDRWESLRSLCTLPGRWESLRSLCTLPGRWESLRSLCTLPDRWESLRSLCTLPGHNSVHLTQVGVILTGRLAGCLFASLPPAVCQTQPCSDTLTMVLLSLGPISPLPTPPKQCVRHSPALTMVLLSLGPISPPPQQCVKHSPALTLWQWSCCHLGLSPPSPQTVCQTQSCSDTLTMVLLSLGPISPLPTPPPPPTVCQTQPCSDNGPAVTWAYLSSQCVRHSPALTMILLSLGPKSCRTN